MLQALTEAGRTQLPPPTLCPAPWEGVTKLAQPPSFCIPEFTHLQRELGKKCQGYFIFNPFPCGSLATAHEGFFLKFQWSRCSGVSLWDSQLQVLPVTFEDSLKEPKRALLSHRASLWKLHSVFVLHSFPIWPGLPLIYGQMRKQHKRKEYLTEEGGKSKLLCCAVRLKCEWCCTWRAWTKGLHSCLSLCVGSQQDLKELLCQEPDSGDLPCLGLII